MRYGAAAFAAVSAWAASQPTFTPVVRTNVMAEMRDGVRLAADVYLPSAEGKFPAIVYRTPYDKRGVQGAGMYFAARGYAVVAQDVRGRFKSEGDFYAFVNEGPDGYDTIEWAARQPWCDGRVVTNGASYLAWDQYHAAMYRPPHLVAMFADVGGNNFYEDFAHPGGAPNLGWFVWIMRSAMTSPMAAREEEARDTLAAALKNPDPWLRKRPEERTELFERFPMHRQMYEDFYAHPAFDAYWQQKGWYTQGSWPLIKDVPIFFISGWYDYFVEGLIQNFNGLSKLHRTPKKLWLGPWPHAVGRGECGAVSFGAAANFDVKEVALDWFDQVLKNDPLEVITADRVRYFRMGGGDGSLGAGGKRNHGGQWMAAPSWPPPASTVSTYFLQSPQSLSMARPNAATSLSWDHDPADPVPSIGGRYTMVPTIPQCAQDQSPLKNRKDILRFDTGPLVAPLDVTGKVAVKLWVSSEAASADFTVKLTDVSPDGFELILGDALMRVANAAGKPREVRIETGSVSNLFGTGHRIRLEVASSNFPRAEPNPLKARNTIHLGGVQASLLELPVITSNRPAAPK